MILFAYDGSAGARQAIAAASELLSGQALVVHIWTPLPPGAAPAVATPGVPGAGLAQMAEAEREIERHSSEILEEGARQAAEAGFVVERTLIRGSGGAAWRELLEVAESRKPDLVVVGRRGMSPLRSVMLGSVSHGIVQHSPVPVLVVPPED
jgi:nucleotide-binding universal stress UspA family protein